MFPPLFAFLPMIGRCHLHDKNLHVQQPQHEDKISLDLLALLYFDAHFNDPCQLCSEIAGMPDHVVAVDSMSCFLGPIPTKSIS